MLVDTVCIYRELRVVCPHNWVTWERLMFYLYEVLSVPCAVQMIMLDVVLLTYCFRATPYFFFPTKERMCFLGSLDMAAVGV